MVVPLLHSAGAPREAKDDPPNGTIDPSVTLPLSVGHSPARSRRGGSAALVPARILVPFSNCVLVYFLLSLGSMDGSHSSKPTTTLTITGNPLQTQSHLFRFDR